MTAAAGTGIGFSAATRCVEEGATVVISDAHERRLGEAADALAELSGTRPLAVPCNVTVEEQVQHLYDAARAEHGRIDVAINNAGLGGNAPIVDMTDEQWSVVLDVTLTGTFRCMRAALRHMYEQNSGVIVNNSSVLGWRAQADQAHYAAAKAGVMALTRCAAVEAAPHNVGSTPWPPAWPCTRFSTGSSPTTSSSASARPSSSAARPRRGRSPTSWSSWPATTPPT